LPTKKFQALAEYKFVKSNSK